MLADLLADLGREYAPLFVGAATVVAVILAIMEYDA